MYPCLTSLFIGNHSVSPYSVTVTTCPQYKSHIRTIKCWGTPISFRGTHSNSYLNHDPLKGFTVVYITQSNFMKFFEVLQYLCLIFSTSFRLVPMEKDREAYRELICLVQCYLKDPYWLTSGFLMYMSKHHVKELLPNKI